MIAIILSLLLTVVLIKLKGQMLAPVTTTDKNIARIKTADAISIVISALCLIFLPFISIISLNCFYICVLLSVACGLSCALFWVIISTTDHPGRYHGNVLVGINILTLVFMLAMNAETVLFNASISFRMIFIVVHLGYIVSLVFYAIYLPSKDNQFGTLFVYGVIGALMVFIALNGCLDISDGTVREYVVISVSEYHDSVDCITDDGDEFRINWSSMEPGDRWYLTTYEGWFNTPYSVNGE